MKNESLFMEIKEKTQCVFASRSKLYYCASWPLKDWHEQNFNLVIEELTAFTEISEVEKYDGFVIEIPEQANTIEKLASMTSRVLNYLASADPLDRNCMDGKIDRKDWKFEFNGQGFHILTFASCYNSAHSRTNFGTLSTFFLFQPSHSFARKRDETGLIPEQIKEKIRAQFNSVGMPYNVDLATSEYSAFKIVKPLEITGNIVRWWEFK